MAGFIPTTHVWPQEMTWMPATSAGMTALVEAMVC
jgi:hypothetical protein